MCNGKLTVNTEKEIGKRRIRLFPAALAACGIVCALCGCTRREQLVLETASTVTRQAQETGQEAADAGRTQAEDTRQGAQGQEPPVPEPAETGTAGQTAAETEPAEGIRQQDAGSATICVHVCGAVKRAGVYELPAGSRVYEAVKEAGGFTEEADESYVNQAQQLADGAKLVIPTVDQARDAPQEGAAGTEQIGIVEQAAAAGGDGMGSGTQEDGRVNINTASEAQLCEIPGIGATRAAAIAAYRQEHGGFNSIEEIMNVSGIKEGTYAKIKDSIKVN